MTADDDAFLRLRSAGQHRYNIDDFNVAQNTRTLLFHLVRIERNFEARVVTAELVVNPPARRSDAAVLLRRDP